MNTQARLRLMPFAVMGSFLLLCSPSRFDVALAGHFPWDQGHDIFVPADGDRDTDPGPDLPCQEGSPVQVATGNFVYFEQDAYITGIGLDLDLTRTYNSWDMRSGIFGHGWTFTYDVRLVETTDGRTTYAVLREAGGDRERFLKNNDGTFTASLHNCSTLSKNPDGSYVLTAKDRSLREFDVSGRILAIVARHGHTMRFSYDSNGFLASITDPSGRQTLLTRGPNGKVASITDHSGRRFVYQYDASDNLLLCTNAVGHATRYEYDSSHNLIRVIDPNGNTKTQITYDSAKRVRTYAEGANVWTLDYQPSQRQTTKTDLMGRRWTFRYNEFGSIVQRIDPLGRTTSMTFDANLNIASMTDESGHVTSYTYDDAANPLSVTDAQGNVTVFGYEPTLKQVASVTDSRGHTSTFSYNAMGDLVALSNALGQTITMTYGADGVLMSVTDALGNRTAYVTDINGYLIEVRDPSGGISRFARDALGREVSTTNARGDATIHEYNANGVVVRQVDALGNETRFAYDANGNVTGVTDPQGHVTTFQYDTFDRLTAIRSALGETVTYVYDASGSVISSTDGKGQVSRLTYDALSRLVSRSMPENTVSYTYDLEGSVLSVIDDDSEVQFVYDSLRRLIRTTQMLTGRPPATIQYSYDSEGSRLSMVDPEGGVTGYAYNDIDRVTAITAPGGGVTTYGYDQLTRRRQVAYPNGVVTEWGFDGDGRLVSLDARLGSAGLYEFGYSYDAVGNVTSKREPQGNHAYLYDALSQLVGASHYSAPNLAETYSYDDAGNRLSSHLVASYVLDAANRVTSDGSSAYQYDGNGNLMSRTEVATGRTTEYYYDALDQLVRIVLPDSTRAEYRYDGLGRRVQKSVGGVVTRYVYDDMDVILEYDGTNIMQTRYLRGTGDDDLISMERDGSTYYYQIDALGTVVGLTNSLGQVVQAYDYDSFGRVVSTSGAIDNPYRFTGRELDSESGLYYFRARYYDCSLGRFIQRDPLGFLGGDYNLYAYTFNNPINWVDPLGLAVGAPGYWESFIPVWGSGRQAIHDFECGRWGWGLFNTGLAVSDAFLVGSAAKSIGKGAWKLGSHSWTATRQWFGRTRGLAKGQEVHHWLIQRNGPIGRHIPDAIKNQPWNLNPMPGPEVHRSLHGVGSNPYGPFMQWWRGTPDWAKNVEANAVGRGSNAARGGSDCNCNP